MNKLETIRAAVDKHFARQAEHDEILEASAEAGESFFDGSTEWAIWHTQHPAMLMLRDILPLLDAAVKIELNDGKLPEFTWYGIVQDYENEVAKLLEEAKKPDDHDTR